MQLPGIQPQWLRTAAAPEPTLVWLDTCELPSARDSKRQSSYINRCEASVCCDVVRTLLLLGVPPGDVGVTSPYSQQVLRLRQAVSRLGVASEEHAGSTAGEAEGGGHGGQNAGKGRVFSGSRVAVMTIDRFQGQDKAVMVVSLVRSNAGKLTGDLLKDSRRINVALTRAKHKVVIVGDSTTVMEVPLLGKVFEGIKRLGSVVRLNASDVDLPAQQLLTDACQQLDSACRL